MSYSSLRDFLSSLEKERQLVHVQTPVSPVLEITEIQTRLLAENGPAVLFENVMKSNGQIYNFPVLVNLFGTVERVAWGMNCGPSQLREIGQFLASLRQPKPPSSLREALTSSSLLRAALAMRPKTILQAPCQEVVVTGDDVDLSCLPIQSCWPGEPAPLITWGTVVTQGPDPAHNNLDNFNLGVYRMQVTGRSTTLMRWLHHRGGAQQFQRWKDMRKELPFPVAVVIGADPAVLLSAVMPLPDNISEYQFSGLLRKRRTELVHCKTVPLLVPARAEIILEGHIALDEVSDEGPYGDHTGYYNATESFPVFRLSAITHRQDALYLSTFTGRPPDEPSVLGEALNELFIPLLTQQFPEIVDFWLPPEGCSYRIVVVSIRKAYPGHARRIMMGIWSFLRQFIYTKFIVVVDDDINVRDWRDVMWAISTRVDPARDMLLISNTPIDYLDFASPEAGLGSKLGLDATAKRKPETNRVWGKKIYMNRNIVETVTEKWLSYGLPGSGRSIWR